VVFTGYLDAQGRSLPRYSDQVAGFKYFSAQTRNSRGLGYGYAFFEKSPNRKICPNLPSGEQPDCGVIYSTGQKMLNTGYMLHPTKWNLAQRDANLKSLLEGLYVQTRSRGEDFLGVAADLTFNEFSASLNERDTMRLNPIFETEDR
jgi:hypothetical protein